VKHARERLVNFAKSMGIPLLRPKDQFHRQGGPALYRDGIHPNAEGNAVLAKFLSDELPAYLQ
jgi:hypothetical protein